MKLTRAEIPMCPECGAECSYASRVQPNCIDDIYLCTGCATEWRDCEWGYHAPDVEGVVREMREYSNVDTSRERLVLLGPGFGALDARNKINYWADRLSPQRKDGEG